MFLWINVDNAHEAEWKRMEDELNNTLHYNIQM